MYVWKIVEILVGIYDIGFKYSTCLVLVLENSPQHSVVECMVKHVVISIGHLFHRLVHHRAGTVVRCITFVQLVAKVASDRYYFKRFEKYQKFIHCIVNSTAVDIFVIRFFPLLRYVSYLGHLVVAWVLTFINSYEKHMFKECAAVSTVPWNYLAVQYVFDALSMLRADTHQPPCTISWHEANHWNRMRWRYMVAKSQFCMPSMVNGKLLSHRESRTITRLGFHFTARIENKRFGGRSISTISTNN